MQTHDPDHELVVSVGRGDLSALRELMARHLTKGVRMAERMLGNRQDAEDVMQDVCLKVWREAAKWQPKAKFSTWLYRVVFNACLDRRRKIIPFVTMVEMETIEDNARAADEVIIYRQRAERVRQALQELPERQRMALILSYYEEASNQESADILEMQLGAFQQLLFRAKQNLKTKLSNELEDIKNGKRARK